ncbi:hypothetical protein DPMN_020344 [Dreissena polymorpha]|uniref:Uncharacterized protein n=1 Tax=Dreissena polymorpha TaxID=45954 RepID=A0A9D4NKZ0_DREPO|nr:hypothetical protein DPMN_020344 [Dreissena polymorpha]
MELLAHNLLSLAVVAVAMAILILTSSVLLPSLNRVASKNLEHQVFQYNDSANADLFHCPLPSSECIILLSQQFLVLTFLANEDGT